MDRLGRVDRRVVGGLFFAPGRLQLAALEQAGGGGELLDADQRGDQLADRQRGRVDGVVGARVGDEAVHVEVLGDPHRAGRGDAEAAGGVGGEGGGVERVGGLRVFLRAVTAVTVPGRRCRRARCRPRPSPRICRSRGGPRSCRRGAGTWRTVPRRVWRRGRGAPSRARRSAPGSGSGRGRPRGSWSRSGGWRARRRGSASRPRAGRCPGGRRRRWRAGRRARRARRRRARSLPWSAPSSGRA